MTIILTLGGLLIGAIIFFVVLIKEYRDMDENEETTP